MIERLSYMTKAWIPHKLVLLQELPQKDMQSMSDQKAKKEFESPTQISSEVPWLCFLKSCPFSSSKGKDHQSLSVL